MDDAPATPKPRRRWKRWVGVVAVVIAIAVLVLTGYVKLQSNGFHRRAARLAIGQSLDEVLRIMGPPSIGRLPDDSQATYVSPSLNVRVFINMNWQRITGRKDFNQAPPGFMEQNTVDVAFQEGRLNYIRRGSEIVRGPDIRPPKPVKPRRPLMR